MTWWALHKWDASDVHITPMMDLRPHDCARTCWCKPDVDDVEDNVFIHHAMDQREGFESGERLPS